MTKNELSCWRHLFNAPYLRQLGCHGIHADHKLIKDAASLGVSTLFELYDKAYGFLLSHYPVEYVLKNELLKWILDQPTNGHICTEHWMHDSTCADVVWITKDCSRVYEIKTRYDSHKRIENQIRSYSKIFDEIFLVTEEGYSFMFDKHAPSYVGLISISSSGKLKILRSAKKHTDTLIKPSMFNSLRAKEQRLFIKECCQSKVFYYQPSALITEEFSVESMQKHMRHYWSNRESIRHLEFLNNLPESFHSAMYDYRILKNEWKRIIDLLRQPLQKLAIE